MEQFREDSNERIKCQLQEDTQVSSKKKYIELVTEQMRCRKARDMVAKELADHIEDQAEVYEGFGLSHDEAEKRAVEQMGDPVDVGTKMDRIHRPRVDRRMIGYIAILAVAGMLVQYLMSKSAVDAVGAENIIGITGFGSIFVDGLIGFAIMLGVMFVDYSFLGKHPIAAYGGFLIILFLYQLAEFWILYPSHTTTNISGLSSMMILMFAAVVYNYRNKGYKGIFSCLLWLFLGFLMLSRMSGVSLAAAVTLFATGILTLSFAVYKGWFNVKKRNALILLWSIWLVPLVGAITALATGLIGKAYQTARIRAFLNPTDDPFGSDYVITRMRERLGDLKLFGSGIGEDVHYWWYSLNFVLEKYGIIMGILLIGTLMLVFSKMLSGVIKQQNRLGTLLGVSAIGYLIATTGLHVMVSLTLLPSTSAYLPFFTEGTAATIGCYMLLGVYLSVHRNAMIVSEKRSVPKRRIRIQIEQVNEVTKSPF